MPSHIFDAAVAATIRAAQSAARQRATQVVTVDGQPRTIDTPFPSPGDWRDTWIYFLLLDRFNNSDAPPAGTWNRRFDFRQGGTFKGVQARLGYLERLGVKAVWLDRELLIVANTGSQAFAGAVVVDRDIHATPHRMRVAYSNLGTTGSGTTRSIDSARFHRNGTVSTGFTAVLDVALAPREVQVLVPD